MTINEKGCIDQVGMDRVLCRHGLISLHPLLFAGAMSGKNSVAIPALRFLDSAAAMPHTFNPSAARASIQPWERNLLRYLRPPADVEVTNDSSS